MTALLKSLEELFKELPPQSRAQVIDFAEFLVKRRKRKPGRKLRQTWAGALSEYRDQYTSRQLQKLALEWRSDVPRG
jgi:nucleoid DNA-binding protein